MEVEPTEPPPVDDDGGGDSGDDDDDGDYDDDDDDDEYGLCDVSMIIEAVRQMARSRENPFGLSGMQMARLLEQLEVLGTLRLSDTECAMRQQMIGRQMDNFLRMNQANADFNSAALGTDFIPRNKVCCTQ